MQVQGPKSKEVVRRLFGDGVAGLRYYWFAETDLDGIPVVVTRTGWSGEVGYEIYLRDGSRGVELWDRVMDAGADLGIAPTGPSDIRRIEAGILNYGIDMTLDTNPYEVGLGWQVDLGQKGDFIGRDALAWIAAEGPRRRLAGVEIAGAPLELNVTRWPVWADGTGGEGGGDGGAGDGGEAGRRRGRRGGRLRHFGGVVAAAEAEYRLRDGAHGVRGVGDAAAGGHAGRGAGGCGCAEAVRGPGQGDPEVVRAGPLITAAVPPRGPGRHQAAAVSGDVWSAMMAGRGWSRMGKRDLRTHSRYYARYDT